MTCYYMSIRKYTTKLYKKNKNKKTDFSALLSISSSFFRVFTSAVTKLVPRGMCRLFLIWSFAIHIYKPIFLSSPSISLAAIHHLTNNVQSHIPITPKVSQSILYTDIDVLYHKLPVKSLASDN